MRKTSSSLSTLSVLTKSAAVTAPVWSIRISRGPSRRKLKPLSASSNWGLDMPKSNNIPSTASIPLSFANLHKSPCRPFTATSPSKPIALVSSKAWSSRSIPRTLPPRRIISLVCPPRPSVPSIYQSPRFTFNAPILSSRRTGICLTSPISLFEPFYNPAAASARSSSPISILSCGPSTAGSHNLIILNEPTIATVVFKFAN